MAWYYCSNCEVEYNGSSKCPRCGVHGTPIDKYESSGQSDSLSGQGWEGVSRRDCSTQADAATAGRCAGVADSAGGRVDADRVCGEPIGGVIFHFN